MASPTPRISWTDKAVLAALLVGLSSSVAGVIGGYRVEGRWAPEIGLPLVFVLIFAAALLVELTELHQRRRGR